MNCVRTQSLSAERLGEVACTAKRCCKSAILLSHIRSQRPSPALLQWRKDRSTPVMLGQWKWGMEKWCSKVRAGGGQAVGQAATKQG